MRKSSGTKTGIKKENNSCQVLFIIDMVVFSERKRRPVPVGAGVSYMSATDVPRPRAAALLSMWAYGKQSGFLLKEEDPWRGFQKMASYQA